MEAQSEKQKEAAAGIPLRIYPALDGSEADVVDRVPFHWHTESEIVIVDAGTVSLVIADRAYQGTRGDIFFIGSEELHEIRATGQGNQFHSFLFSLELLEFARADGTAGRGTSALPQASTERGGGAKGAAQAAGPSRLCLPSAKLGLAADSQGGPAGDRGGVRGLFVDRKSGRALRHG